MIIKLKENKKKKKKKKKHTQKQTNNLRNVCHELEMYTFVL